MRTMRLALDDAGLAPRGCRRRLCLGERDAGARRREAAALTQLFGGSRTVVTSIKGALGESGASGGAACAAALLCGRAGTRPADCRPGDADAAAAAADVWPREAVDAPGPIVLVNSFASGGALFSVVLRVAGVTPVTT